MAKKETEDIYVVPILSTNSKYFDLGELLKETRKALREYSGKAVLLVFPESIFGTTPIDRVAGKKVALELNHLLAKHGRAYAAYSVYEKRPKRAVGGNFVTNSGYFITPNRDKKYQVYPKLTTFENGQFTTIGEAQVIRNNSATLKEAVGKVEHTHKLGKRIRNFPRVKINGAVVELRICADVTMREGADKVPAKKSRRKSHLIVIPANGLELKPHEFHHLSGKFRKGGFGLILDKSPAKNKSSVNLIKNGHTPPPKRADGGRAVKIGRFRVVTHRRR